MSYAVVTPAGPYGSTSGVIVGPTGVNLQSKGADMSGAAAADAVFTAAKADLPNGKGRIYIPPGTVKFLASPSWGSGVDIEGAGEAATKLNLFAPCQPNGSEWHVRHLTLIGNAAHLFQPPVGAVNSLSSITDCELDGSAGAFSLWTQDATAQYVRIEVERCFLNAAGGATSPAWNLVNSGGGVNANSWKRSRIASNLNGQPFFWLESSGVGQYIYDNTLEDLTGEQNNGGVIVAKGTQGTRMMSVFDFDTVNYLADVFSFTNSSGGAPVPTRGLVAILCGRRGGALGAFHDFSVLGVPAPQNCWLINCFPTSGNPVNNLSGSVTPLGPGAAFWDIVSSQQQIYAGRLDGNGAQVATAIWAGTGAPSNANGANGDYYFRSDGGPGTSIYQKRAGAWAATGA